MATLLPVQAWAAPPGGRTGFDLPKLQADEPAAPDEERAAAMAGWVGGPTPSPVEFDPSKVSPPAGDSEPVTLKPTDTQLVQAGALPVKIGKTATPTAPDTPVPSGTWSVAVKSRADTEAAGVDGAIIKVTPPAQGSAPVDVELNYGQFKDLFGTEWSTRLEFRQFPACFFDTPDLPECATATPIPSANNPDTKTVRATIDPAGAAGAAGGAGAAAQGTAATASAGPVVMVASDSTKGPANSYKASPLSPSGTWTAGGSGGGFSWTYPLTVPAPPAGPAPKIAFSYSSQAVDGKTSVTNGQASWVGDGWDYAPGFIERRYRSCSEDREPLVKDGPAPNNDNATDKKKGDLCWAGDNLVMSLGGSTTELVPDAANPGTWVPSADDGSRVERVTVTDPDAPRNEAKDGEYWVVTTRDGTRYHFGRHNVGAHGDGSTKPTVTNSVFYTPVFGNHPGEPCNTSTYAASSCRQGWRWNLDYVEDVHGNAMVIDWAREENRYARNEKFQETAKDKVGYIRGGHPTRILYGLRAADLDGTPAAKVEFGVTERCEQEVRAKCDPAKFDSKNYEDKQVWWDTPATLNCRFTDKNCYVGSPSFWSRKRLVNVKTFAQRTEGSTALSQVDQWDLKQFFPTQSTDTHPPLWLSAITRYGYGTLKDEDGDVRTDLPEVSFLPNDEKTPMPNRVQTGSKDETPGFGRQRVQTIRTETGGEIYVDYSSPCAFGSRPDPVKNDTRCYPVHWSPDPTLENPPLEYFNKYVVDSVTERDRVSRQPGVVTRYVYEGGTAWAKDTDEFTKPRLRTYNQWRGYASVLVQKGATARTGEADATVQSQTRTRYFRGMSGDAGRAKFQVKDSTGTELAEDLLQYQGMPAETITYDRAPDPQKVKELGRAEAEKDIKVLSREVNWPESHNTGSRPRKDNTTLEAYRTRTVRTDAVETVTGGTRTVRTRSTYDDEEYGLLKTVQKEAVTPSGTSDQTCAATGYVHNERTYLIGLPHEVRTTAGTCAQRSTGTLLSAVRTSYDALNAFGKVPTKGLARQVDTNDAAGTGWITTARSEYDALGRVTKIYDAAGNATSTSFSPATGSAFTTTVTNPLGHTTTTKTDPGRGSALETTDANGHKVTMQYDHLGRTTKVWTPSRKPASDKPAYTFGYRIAAQEPPAVTTRVLRDNGTYEVSTAIHDGLLRPVQTQKEALGGGRIITDTYYNQHGAVRRTDNEYHAEGEPTEQIFYPRSDFSVANSTQTAYDGAGRPVRATTFHKGDKKYSGTTQYGGDWTLARTGMSADGVTPLSGSRAVKSWTDVLGRTSKIQHFTSTDLATANDTTYTYDLRGKLTQVSDAAGNDWTYTYDGRGRKKTSDDPDMGRAEFVYNDLDQVTWTRDATGRAQHHKYDVLGRKVALRDDAWDGKLVAAWTFDTLPGAKGQPVASIAYDDNGKAFTSEVTGYDAEYRPTGSKLTIPDTADTKGLAGTYAYGTTYTPTGKVQSTTVPATPGGLAAERLVTRYNAEGAPTTFSGLSWYTADTVYSPYGEVLRTASGPAPERVWTTNFYDVSTGRVTESLADRETGPQHRIAELKYAYDTVGNITSVADKQPAGTDRQCYRYDPLGQLVEAWTSDNDKCRAAAETELTDVTPGPDGDGYWQQYEFDRIGNRTKLIDKDLTNGALDDKYTYEYGVTVTNNGTQPTTKTQPHALTKVTAETRDPGSTITSVSTYGYDSAGNTTRRTINGDTQTLTWDRRNKLTSADSPGIGAFPVLGLAGKCLDVQSAATVDGTPIQLYSCNDTKAQQWRLSKQTLQAFGKCATSTGGAVTLATCNGGTNQKFVYRATDKTLHHPATNKCVEVPGANSTNGTDLTLAPCSAGAAHQQWSFTDTTTYLYDADGNRLIENTGATRTLYLADAEITVDSAGKALDAQRYYASPGGPTTVRHTFGKTIGHNLNQLLSDHHNTATTSIDQDPGQAVSRRKSDPYGNPRGTQPTGWPGNRTFLGVGIDDTTTGLTHIGAREYDPTTGRFISVDPIIDNTDPLQMNGYTYANGNPLTNWDPTGLQLADMGGSTRPARGFVDEITVDDSVSDSGGASAGSSSKKGKGCGWNAWCHAKKKGKATGHWINKHKVTIVSITTEVVVGAGCVAGAGAAGLATGGAGFGLVVGCGAVAGAAGAAVTNAMTPGADHSVMGLLKDVGIGAGVGAAGAALGFGAGKVIAKTAAKFRGGGAAARGGSCTGNSFTVGTSVALANGTTKAIEDIKPGDLVLATDPETGRTVPKEVTATIAGEGVKKLVDIMVTSDSSAGDVITATDGHPFWIPELNKWLEAKDLQPGQWLQTSSGTYVQISAIQRRTSLQETVHNLTVTDLHTYYVLAGATPVLVHNCTASTPQDGSGLSDEDLLTAAQGERDRFAREIGAMPTNKRPAVVTAGYNTETRQFAAAANAFNGACAEACVVSALGGDPGKIVFTSAVRPRKAPTELKQVKICSSCESRYGRGAFPAAGTVFSTDVLRLFD